MERKLDNQELDKDRCQDIRQRKRMMDAEIEMLEKQRQTASNMLMQTRNRLMQDRSELSRLMQTQIMAESAIATASPSTDSATSTTIAMQISVIEARIQMLENEEETFLRDINSIDDQLSDFRSSREANAAEATRLNCAI